ncbi:unnamed protein product [Sympodiomycopsis kandeliae]
MPVALQSHQSATQVGSSSSKPTNRSNGAPLEDAEDGDGDGELEDQEDDDDWLMSSDDEDDQGSRRPNLNAEQGMEMANRDSAKVQRQFYDTGYREGITSGKLSTLQVGFDQGFNQSSSIGRSKGNLRGQANAIHIYLTEYTRQKQSKRKNNKTDTLPSSSATINTSRKILSQVSSLNVDNLLEPDWEARKHELEHAGGDQADQTLLKETEQQRYTRLHKLDELKSQSDQLLADVLR